MKDYNTIIPYMTASGSYSGNTAVHRWTTGTHGVSPRVNGRLMFRQNAYSANSVTFDYEPIRRYITRHGLPEVGYPPSSGYLHDSSTEGLMGSLYPFESGFYDHEPSPADTMEAFVQTEAMIKCLSQAGSFQANLADMYRTRKETVNMITHRVGQLANAMFALRKGNWRGMCGALGIPLRHPRRHLGDVPGVWLEYIYGWKPLIEDCYALINHPFPEPYKICHGRKTMIGTRKGVMGAHGPDQLSLDWTVTSKTSSHVRCKITTSGAALAAASQLGVTNPAALAWESLPFSFVVDWFYPVGNYLEMLTATAGLQFSDATQTNKSEMTMSGEYVWIGKSQVHIPYAQEAYEIATVSGSISRKRYSISRGFATMAMPFPRLKNPVSLTHFANATSLLSRAFKR